jgi:hypothetical protein
MKRLLLASVASWLVVVPVLTLMATPAGAVAPIREPYGPGSAGGSIAGTYPAGVACPFAVSFEIVAGGTGQQWIFLDQNGDVARIQNRVGPSTWVITNVDSGDSHTLQLPAGNGMIRFAADGTLTVTISGGVIGFNAPTDTPPGPFSLAVAGHVVFVVAPDGTGTLAQESGKVTDLCAAVS